MTFQWLLPGIKPQPHTVEPLLKDTIHLTSLLRTNVVVPIGPWQYNFTSERGQPLYNSKIMPKIAGPKVSVI